MFLRGRIGKHRDGTPTSPGQQGANRLGGRGGSGGDEHRGQRPNKEEKLSPHTKRAPEKNIPGKKMERNWGIFYVFKKLNMREERDRMGREKEMRG